MVVGIIGAGRLGSALTRLSLRAGHDVILTNSRGPASLELTARVLYPGVQLLPPEELVRRADVIILALPFHQAIRYPADFFEGKIVIDATNYWAPTEGIIAELDASGQTSSQYLQAHLTNTQLVKTLNHVAYAELEEHSGTGRAVLVAGDDQAAKGQVVQYVESLGFDAVDLGSLENGSHFQPDTQLFNARFGAEELGQR